MWPGFLECFRRPKETQNQAQEEGRVACSWSAYLIKNDAQAAQLDGASAGDEDARLPSELIGVTAHA